MHRYDSPNLRQSLSQILFYTSHILEHPIVLDCFERRGHRSHRQHATTKCSTEIVLFNARRYRVRNQTSPNRNTTAERLRECHDIGNNTITRFIPCKEPLSSSSHTSLHFIVNEHDAAFVTQR